MTPLNKITITEMPDVEVGMVIDIEYWLFDDRIKEHVRVVDVQDNAIYFEGVDDTSQQS